jgi:hypothetical protein
MHLGLEILSGSDNIPNMAKEHAKSPRKNSYSVAGITRDGVSIIKVGKATHFTDRQARDAVAKVRSLAASALTQSSSRSK